MAAHRYWRVLGLESYAGGDLELSAVHLLDGAVRVDAPAALTSTVAPASGAVAHLQDDDLGTTARWSARDVPLVVLTWDCGSPVSVTDMRLGSAGALARFALVARLQWSDTGTDWNDLTTFRGISWPGPFAKTASVMRAPPDLRIDAVALHFRFDRGISDSAPVPTSSAPSVGGNAVVSTAWSKAGGASLLLDGAGDFVELNAASAINASTGAITWEAWIKPTAVPTAGNTNNRYVLRCGNQSGTYIYGYVLGLRWNGTFAHAYCIVGTGAETRLDGVTPVAVNQEYHLAAVIAGGQMTLWVNGAQDATMTLPGPPQDGTPYFAIGRDVSQPGARDFAGYIDEVRITQAARYTAPFSLDGYGVQGIAEQSLMAVNKALARPPREVALVGSAGAMPHFSGTVLSNPLRARPDYVLGGKGRVRGTVKNKGTPSNTPVYRRVFLVRLRGGMVVGEQWTDPVTGAYDFQWVSELHDYIVMSLDHTRNFRMVSADYAVMELMP